MELIPIIVVLAIVVLFLAKSLFIVKQQESAIIERLGKFNRISQSGLRFKIPFIETIATRLSLRTGKVDFPIDAKTSDNVTITLRVSAQYHVDFQQGATPTDSGTFRAFYTLAQPLDQMHDYIADALRSAIPKYTLDEVFAKKDDIAHDVNSSVSQTMMGFGWVLVSTLITSIGLPATVEQSMNDINAAQRQQQAAQSLANADKIKRVTEAQAEAEAMEKTGKGIAAQRVAIADGIAASLEAIHKSGVSEAEANELFLFTQWIEMMSDFASSGKAATVVLPSSFDESRSMFQQMLSVKATDVDERA